MFFTQKSGLLDEKSQICRFSARISRSEFKIDVSRNMSKIVTKRLRTQISALHFFHFHPNAQQSMKRSGEKYLLAIFNNKVLST